MTGDPESVGADGGSGPAQRCGLLGVVAADLQIIRRQHLHLPGQSLELTLNGSAARAAGRPLQQLSPGHE